VTPINSLSSDDPSGSLLGMGELNRPAQESSLIARFEVIARRYPGKIALSCDGQQWTYAELDAEANGISRHLHSLELAPRTMIAIWLDRSLETISSMLGVLKAGHAYLPLEATYPAARIAETLADAEPVALISRESLASTLRGVLPEVMSRVVLLDQPLLSGPEIESVEAGSGDLAYVMYTSGSTGKPKGVLVTHGNVMRLFDRTATPFHFSAEDTWTMFHSFAFDFSVWEIWGALLTGARLVVVPFAVSRSPDDFYKLLSRESVTVLNQTPSAFELLSQAEERGPQLSLALRLIIFGGEALKFSALRPWFARHGDTHPRIVNCYGITETTVHVTARAVTQADALQETDSLIGEPVDDLRLHLLDESLAPVPEGETGEIFVSGPGVSLGYLNRPALTAERFLSDPFVAGACMYRSGDLAMRRPDGELVYAGRRDDQVKISGFRIELGEVESALLAFPGIHQACVVPHTGENGHAQLAAYIVEHAAGEVSIPAVAEALMEKLPAQMLPAFYTTLDALPLTANGKIDRKALPAPGKLNLFRGAAERAPLSEMEESVLALVRETALNDSIGLDDNFFMAGGYSLLGTQFVLRARRQYGIDFSLRDLFEVDTIGELARLIETRILEDIEALSEGEALRLLAKSE
jgi:amino acid adenylation domain-containing protein